MSKLIYSAIASLDGYVADSEGGFEWAAPDDEVHAFVNDLERPIGTYLYGRRMYDVMKVWETFGDGEDDSDATRDYAAIWRSADKVVYSRSLTTASTARTRIEPAFDPDAINRLKAASGQDITVGGPTLAGQIATAGLVDEYHLFLTPAVVGGGTAALPDGLRLDLELIDSHRFAAGVVYLAYRPGG